MTEHLPGHEVRQTRTLQFARWIVRHRFWVAMFLILTTLFFFYPTLNAILGGRLPGPVVRLDASERALFPQHPFIAAQDKFSTRVPGAFVINVTHQS